MIRHASIRFPSRRKRRVFFPLLLVALFAALPFATAPPAPAALEPPASELPPRSSADRNGVLAAQDGGKLRLTADLGTVRIFTLAPGEAPVVRYAVHIETNAQGPLARKLLSQYSLKAESTPAGVRIESAMPRRSKRERSDGAQFWVRIDVFVPRNYSVEVLTGGGDIETQDIGGTASLVTGGGFIRCGRIGGSGMPAAAGKAAAYLETQGGHISAGDVAGELYASTGGGHIQAEEISGQATLHSGGGHIRAARIGGKADLSTDGGNITVGQAGGMVAVRTGGGQIDFGEVRGSVQAQTGGGGIRIASASGPMQIETSGGSIWLTRIAGAVSASTSNGTITAFINPEALAEGGTVRLAGASLLASRGGDIFVYLPRNLSANIEAVVAGGGVDRIQADPGLPVTVRTEGPAGGGQVRASATLNGGGTLLRLRTDAGRIRLQYLDSDIALRESLLREEAQRIEERMREVHREMAARMNEFQQAVLQQADGSAETLPPDEARGRGGWLSLWWEIEEKLRGGINADAAELRKRAVYAPPPVYPPLAKQAGIQGLVRLSVRVDKSGNTEVLKVLEGEPVLADAAIAAVKQWRYRQQRVNGIPVSVISEVTFNFVLR